MSTPRANPLFAFAALAGGLALAGCQWLVFVYAPTAADTGIIQKIFYLHLPLAWWALIGFFTTFVASILYLATKKAHWDLLAGAAAEVGVVLAGLALITGSIWARRSWGVWWTWDPRLTTTLIMWFVYAGYLVVRKLELPEIRRANICAVVGIAAFIDVPLVFFSARLWRSIHPAVFAAKGGGLDPNMKVAVITCVLIFGLFWAGLTAFRYQLARQERSLAGLTAARLARDS